jgi:hypothetical protein
MKTSLTETVSTSVTITMTEQEARLLINLCRYQMWNALYKPVSESLREALVSAVGESE